MRLVWGRVTSVDADFGDIQHLSVEIDDGTCGSALCYPMLCGVCDIGERVLLNTTAVDLELGTGGSHYVVSRGMPDEGVAYASASGGHIMKARYTPLQVDVLAVEAPESAQHDVMSQVTSVDGMPVVCCGLHSQVPLVAAAVKHADPKLRVVYCMTDSASLPMPLSNIVRQSVGAGLIDVTVTCGQAFGGMLETVNLHSGMLAAKHVAQADVAIVAIGPGIVGTSTPFGHGGVAQGEAINAADAVGGRPIACLRVSFADPRERHRGVSHHTISALTGIAAVPSKVAVPEVSSEFSDAIEADLANARVFDRHHRITCERYGSDMPDMRGVEVVSMGRRYDDDPAFFKAAFSAGDIASRIAIGMLM